MEKGFKIVNFFGIKYMDDNRDFLNFGIFGKASVDQIKEVMNIPTSESGGSNRSLITKMSFIGGVAYTALTSDIVKAGATGLP
jgi:hypothetical protein